MTHFFLQDNSQEFRLLKTRQKQELEDLRGQHGEAKGLGQNLRYEHHQNQTFGGGVIEGKYNSKYSKKSTDDSKTQIMNSSSIFDAKSEDNEYQDFWMISIFLFSFYT